MYGLIDCWLAPGIIIHLLALLATVDVSYKPAILGGAKYSPILYKLTEMSKGYFLKLQS